MKLKDAQDNSSKAHQGYFLEKKSKNPWTTLSMTLKLKYIVNHRTDSMIKILPFR